VSNAVGALHSLVSVASEGQEVPNLEEILLQNAEKSSKIKGVNKARSSRPAPDEQQLVFSATGVISPVYGDSNLSPARASSLKEPVGSGKGAASELNRSVRFDTGSHTRSVPSNQDISKTISGLRPPGPFALIIPDHGGDVGLIDRSPRRRGRLGSQDDRQSQDEAAAVRIGANTTEGEGDVVATEGGDGYDAIPATEDSFGVVGVPASSFRLSFPACAKHLESCEAALCRMQVLVAAQQTNLKLVIHEPELWHR
jgi:hypothetical protein